MNNNNIEVQLQVQTIQNHFGLEFKIIQATL